MRTITTVSIAATTLAAGLLLAGPAQAAPACSDPVATTVHAVHDATGDPAGAGHTVEETYCGVKP